MFIFELQYPILISLFILQFLGQISHLLFIIIIIKLYSADYMITITRNEEVVLNQIKIYSMEYPQGVPVNVLRKELGYGA